MVAWKRNLYILMVSQFLVMGAMSMIIPFLPLYLQQLGVKSTSEAQMWSGIVFGSNFLTAFAFAPLWGSLADRYGRKVMILRSGFGMAIVIFLTGLATSPLQLVGLRLLNGVVSGFIPASISMTATNTPKEHTGYALGLLQSGGVAGSICGPLLGGILSEVIGFREIFFVTSTLLLLATLVVLFAVKEASKPNPQVKQGQFWADASQILHIRPLLVLFGVAVLLQFAMVGPFPLMSLFVQELGGAAGHIAFFAGLVAAITGIANILASPMLGKLGDRIGSGRILFIALLGAALFFIPHAWVHSIWQLIIVRFLLGLCVGGLTPSLNAMIRKYAPVGKEGTVFGYYTSAVFLGNLLGPITYGFLSGWVGIRNVFILTSFLLIGAAIALKAGLHIRLKEPYQKLKKLA